MIIANDSATKSSWRSVPNMVRALPRSNLSSAMIASRGSNRFGNHQQHHDQRTDRLDHADYAADHQRLAAGLLDRCHGDLHAQPHQAESEEPGDQVAEHG